MFGKEAREVEAEPDQVRVVAPTSRRRGQRDRGPGEKRRTRGRVVPAVAGLPDAHRPSRRGPSFDLLRAAVTDDDPVNPLDEPGQADDCLAPLEADLRQEGPRTLGGPHLA